MERGTFVSTTIATRTVTPEDAQFLVALYASVRTELGMLPGDEAFRNQILGMQFRAQQAGYERQFPSARHRILLENGQPVGRLLVNRTSVEVRLVDISLLPEWRGRGVGGRLISELISEAAEARLPLRLQVWKDNPAVRLYRRLGFHITGERDLYLQMEMPPAA